MILVAPGPSLSRADCELVERFRRARRKPGVAAPFLFAIGDAYRRFGEVDAVYHADIPWWQAYASRHVWPVDGHEYIGAKVAGRFAIVSHKEGGDVIGRRLGLDVIETKSQRVDEATFSRKPGVLHEGWNSGFQGLNAALILTGFGVGHILLLGYDMMQTGGRNHYFGDHPPELHRPSDYGLFAAAFHRAAARLHDGERERIINCSRASAIECFRRGDLAEELGKLDAWKEHRGE